MRTTIISIICGLLLLPVSGSAAEYAKTITVAKSGGDFASPEKALASISSASEQRRFLVKIQPGTYNLGSNTLQMKEFVDVEGSGADTTIITAANANVDTGTCVVGTVKMSNNSVLKNISVVNSFQDPAHEGLTAAIVFENVTARIEGTKVQVGSNDVYTAQNYGICSVGSGAHAYLDNVAVEVRNGTNSQSGAIALLSDASVTLQNSKLAAITMKDGHTHVIDCISGHSMMGKLTVSDTLVEGTVQQASGGNRGIDAYDCSAAITNSIVRLTGGDDNYGVRAKHGDLTIDSSKIFSPEVAIINGGDAKVKLSNSLVQGRIVNMTNMQLSNNVTENNVPIPNK